ncbi:MAG: ABC transporter permease, partial [Anaerolineae bacterium]|nr:ABC transporter permease [Anaerolineae bacterium]
MLRTRARKIIRDVLARKGRTLLVSMAIFIGVAGTIALFSLSDIIVSQLREDIKESELSMLDAFVTVNTGTELDNEAYLERLRAIPGITEVMGSIQNTVYFKADADSEEFDDGIVNAYSFPYEQRLPIIPMRLIEGEYPTEGANEVAIEKRTAEEYGLRVGDPVYFRILSPSRSSQEIGTTETWTVSGIVFHPYTFSPNFSFYTSLNDGNYISGTTGYSVLSARFEDYSTAEEQKETFTNVVADETLYIPVFVQSEDPANNSLIQGAQQISGTMGFLAIVALIVSGFLVVNVISSIVVEQKRQIGVMKSMGASRMDNFLMYAGIAFAYGLIGVIPGVLVGIPGGNAAAQALAPQLNTSLEGFKTSPSSIILGIIVGLLVPVFASIIPVFFGTRVKILEAMTDLGIDANYGSGPIAKFIGLLPIPITVRQGLSNVSIKKSRVIFTVITLAIAAGAFMGIYAVFNSLTTGLNS